MMGLSMRFSKILRSIALFVFGLIALANNQVFAQDGQTLPPGGAADGSVGTGFVLPGIVVCLLMGAALYAVCRSSHRV